MLDTTAKETAPFSQERATEICTSIQRDEGEIWTLLNSTWKRFRTEGRLPPKISTDHTCSEHMHEFKLGLEETRQFFYFLRRKHES